MGVCYLEGMTSYDEVFGGNKGGGGGAGARQRAEAEEKQAQKERDEHEKAVAKQEPVQEKLADDKDVALSNPRWSVEKAFFTQKATVSVNVAIPGSRGGATKVTFTLYATLPGGKRSKPIATAEGHPDSSGMATAEFVLHYPGSEERVIVKPVESYPYFFTAKHKYSKEMVGPNLTVVDHAVSTVQFIPSNIDINLP
jgi:hypothetical protein